MLFTLPSLLNLDQAAALRRELSLLAYEDGTVTANGIAARAKNNQQLGFHTPKAHELSNEVASVLLSNASFQRLCLPVKLTAPMFNLYREGMYYGPHSDSALMRSQNGPIRGDLSMTIFLSDPSEYAGGELHISDANSGNHYIKLPAGSAICYPSYAVHEVLPVTAGARWACVLWIQSAIRDPYKRTVLWQLDQVQQKIEQGQIDPALVELSQATNNLLRLWAET